MVRVRGKDWMQEHVADRYVRRAQREGMRSRAAQQFALKASSVSLATLSYEELVDRYYIIAGTPDEVTERFARVKQELGIGHLLLEAQESRMDHPTTMRSIELMGRSLIPAVAKL